MTQETESATQWGQIITLVVLIIATLVTLVVVSKQEKTRNRLLREKDVTIAARDQTIAKFQRTCCLPCQRTLSTLNCVPSLCTQTAIGLCCVEATQ